MSIIGNLYDNLYDKLCGRHPSVYPWHFQWLAVKELYCDLRRILPNVEGKLLDVGCGDKPYQVWLNLDKVKHIGIDIYPSSQADFVIENDQNYPFENNYFDIVLCTQVLEHTGNINNTLKEIRRILQQGGLLILSVPFIYNQHGAPSDYRRFSIYGIENLLKKNYEFLEVKSQGGIGSTTGLLLLNWIQQNMNLYKPTRLLKGLLLPVWIIFCLLINVLGYLLDKFDKTNSFYSNVFAVVRKKCD
jgi:SAM-dependent methyltransferase